MREVARTLPERSRAVAELVAERAAGMEIACGIDADVITGMAEAGFMRHCVPTEFGGRGGGFGELLDAVALIGAECAASAWCASLFAATTRFLEPFPQEVRHEVWATGPDAVVVASTIPCGKAAADGDGVRVSGRWPYLSAVEFADWAVLCAALEGPGGEPELKLVAVPAAHLWVERTWQSAGMCATGSHTAVLADVAVPASRMRDLAELFSGPVPLGAVNGLTFVAPALGAARGALRALTGRHSGRGAAGSQTGRDAALARSAAEIDSVELLLRRAAAVADTGSLTAAEVARNSRDSAFAIEVLTGAVNRMFLAAGTGGQLAGAPLQRLWRDVNSVATHRALQFEPAAQNYVRSLARDRADLDSAGTRE
ncbi:acyl-CoA dehydrogenase family protein [Saccharopolyspora sp. NPDC047091]|uniref:acyl-CoA dehydrogenase family protein n=1 Tax=Saccharopolyspora sp. NPDC047091 TaxID=3155924 RepID=UPI0033EB5576